MPERSEIKPKRPMPTRPPIEWPARSSYQRPELNRQATPQHTPESKQSSAQKWDEYHRKWQAYYQAHYNHAFKRWQQEYLKSTDENKSANPVKKPKVKRSTKHALLCSLAVMAVFLFIQYNQVIIGHSLQWLAPSAGVELKQIVEPHGNVSREPKILIPKIGVDAAVVYDSSIRNEAAYQKALEKGVVRFSRPITPGQTGNLLLGGHSSDNIFNPGNYKYIFSHIRYLEESDLIQLNFEGKRYLYKVAFTRVVSADDPQATRSINKAELTLFTCDPPGTAAKRLIVRAQLIEPDPTITKPTTPEDATQLPVGEPSVWRSVF